jgi:malic enzyme
LIREPLLNKGSAFSREERAAFGLEGMLPHAVLTIDQQARRSYRNLTFYNDPLKQYVYLASLHERNETLYFKLLEQYLEELLPIVYTPTVGLATRRYSQVFQRGRGVWVTPGMRGEIAAALKRWAGDRQIRLVVATDNESILGIGDQGAGGMAISIGKLSLYTAGAGIDPATVLPVSLDVGTNNDALLKDPNYIGWPEARLQGDAYLSLVDEFIAAVQSVFPGALVQWEDFRKDNALRVLDRFAQQLPSFNDDIQGTGSMALAGILSAERSHGRSLDEERILIHGAGAAGLGIARQIRTALITEGCSEGEAKHSIAVLDSRGLLVDNGELSDAYKRELAWDPAIAAERQLKAGSALADVVIAF